MVEIYKDLRVIISMIIMCSDIAIVIIEHIERSLGFSNTPVVIENENKTPEQ